MRILITGATGFIGSHLVSALVGQKHEVFTSQRSMTGRYVQGAEQGVFSLFFDLNDHSSVRQAVRDVQPEVVIHLAAISPVAYSYDHANEVNEANYIGTINLAESCLRDVAHFRQFLFASTSETYGNGPVPKREDSPQYPNSPYAVSKLAAEKYVLYLRDAQGFPVTVLRPFNTYGRKDNTHYVVERTIVQMLRGQTVRLGSAAPVRDLLHVNDHINAYLICLGNPKAIGEVFNFSTGRGVSVGELVHLLARLSGFGGEIAWNTIPRRPLDIDTMIGDSSKAERILGWRAQVSLEDGLREAINYWHQQMTVAQRMADSPQPAA